jgi:hypothetical protein
MEANNAPRMITEATTMMPPFPRIIRSHAMNHALPEPPLGLLTTADLVAIVSPAARYLLVAVLEALRKNTTRSHRFLALSEEALKDERELCYTLHIASMILFWLGDPHDAVTKDTRCLELCARLGLKELQLDALSHLSSLYPGLGREDLAKAYAPSRRTGGTSRIRRE